MEPIAVTAALLRAQLPDLPLREGDTLIARVDSRRDKSAVIVLAGVPLTAQVPPEVQAGATLRLKVQEVTPERITLRIDPRSEAAAAPPPGIPRAARPGEARAPAPLPPAQVKVEESPARRRGADGAPADVVTLAFTSPTL